MPFQTPRGRTHRRPTTTSGKELFDLLKCQQCHVLGAIPKDQPTSNLAPDLRMALERLQPDWILDWLKNPAAILPGTRMPAFWPEHPKSSYPQLGGNAEAQIRAIRDYLHDVQGRPEPDDAARGRRTSRRCRDRQDAAGCPGATARPPGTPALPAPTDLPSASVPAIILRMLRPHRGRLPLVHPAAFIDDSAQVIGDVEIGEDSSVWMMVVIRGDVHRIRIGRRTNVQDGTVVHVMKDTHPTTIGDDVTIGHAARHSWLHDRRSLSDRHGRDPPERRAHRHRLDRRRRLAGPGAACRCRRGRW